MDRDPGTRDVARASAVLIFAFLGVESALVPSGEVHDPSRTVPRAIFLAMIGATVLYLSRAARDAGHSRSSARRTKNAAGRGGRRGDGRRRAARSFSSDRRSRCSGTSAA